MNIEEEQLYQKLIKNKVSITKEEYAKAVQVYKNLFRFYLNLYIGLEYNNCLSIFNLPKRNFSREERYYLKIFLKIIELQKNNLLKYLDYAIILDNMNVSFGTNKMILKELYEFLDCICHNKNHVLDFFESNNYFISNIAPSKIDFKNICTSESVPDSYKMILKLFKDIFNKYHENYCDKEELYIGFDVFLNYIHYYFLENDLFNDYEKIIAFLNDINDNMSLYMDYIIINGFEDKNKIIDFIDYVFNNFQKVKIMK